jgi:hypothetical protein
VNLIVTLYMLILVLMTEGLEYSFRRKKGGANGVSSIAVIAAVRELNCRTVQVNLRSDGRGLRI